LIDIGIIDCWRSRAYCPFIIETIVAEVIKCIGHEIAERSPEESSDDYQLEKFCISLGDFEAGLREVSCESNSQEEDQETHQIILE